MMKIGESGVAASTYERVGWQPRLLRKQRVDPRQLCATSSRAIRSTNCPASARSHEAFGPRVPALAALLPFVQGGARRYVHELVRWYWCAMHEERNALAPSVVVRLPTEFVVRYRAVDRELVPSAIVDTASHRDALTASIREHGVQIPLRLSFNNNFGLLDGNHRIVVARRLGLRGAGRGDPRAAGPPARARPAHAATGPCCLSPVWDALVEPVSRSFIGTQDQRSAGR